jgi:hypothetical protein
LDRTSPLKAGPRGAEEYCVTEATPVAAWLLEVLPPFFLGAIFAAAYALYLGGVYAEARRLVERFNRRRRALERVEWWYPEGRVIPAPVAAARSRLDAERRALERAGILRRSRSAV